ncbi:hypothetical protein ABPG72_016708 [Tetrahymena utriculariae]
MNSSKIQSIWGNLPDKLIKLSTSLKDYIEADSYLSDDDHLQFQMTSVEIKAFKNDLHEGVAYSKFIETQENKQILCQYLQYQLNHIENLRRDFNIFINKNNLFCNSQRIDFYTPYSPNISPPQQSMRSSNPSSPFQFDGRVNQKKNFIGSIRFFLQKLQCQRETYLELYSQKEGVNKLLSEHLIKHKSKLPQTTYSLERLCEIVRSSLQELRSQIIDVSIDERNSKLIDEITNIKKQYNKIKTIPLIQYITKLFKVIKELKTLTFQFTKAIATFEKHLNDKKSLQNAQELIEHIESESDVRFRMRQQSDPTQELTPGKNDNNRALTESKTLSKCGNENTIYSFNIDAQSEQTDDESSIQDNTSSLFQSVMSSAILDRRAPSVQNVKQQSDCDKENTRQSQNQISQKQNTKNSKISSSHLNKDQKAQALGDMQQVKTSKINKNTNNSQKSNQIETNEDDNQTKTAPILKSKTQESSDSVETQENLHKSEIKSKTEDIYSQKNNSFYNQAKESLVSNAQSSFVDDQTQVQRKYKKKSLFHSDDKCISNCSIF